MKTYLECHELDKVYPTPDGGEYVVVKDFSLKLSEGEFVTLIGHSGCGKSTVLSMIAGLTPKSGGYMILGDYEIAGAGPDRGVVFQSPCLLPWMTTLDNVLVGVNQVFPHESKSQRDEIARYYLNLVGLAHAIHKTPAELSQGMRQRVGIARAFALHPKVLLLDEPFGMLDSLTRMELQEVLLQLWRKDKKTALMVTHDVDEALYLSDRIVMMTNGPSAKVGDIVEVPFPRPRNRSAVLDHPEYYRLRERLITFLENQSHAKGQAQKPPAPHDVSAETAEASESEAPEEPAPASAAA
jgi:nitrate ABC transporter ATP-binding subunit